MNTYIKINEYLYDDKNYWLLKPTDLNGGKCINITSNVEEIEKLLKKYYEGVEMDQNIQEDEDSGNEEEINGNNKENTNGHHTNGSSNDQKANSPEKVEKKGFSEKNPEEKKKEEQSKLRKYRSNFILLQKYIEKPLLYYGRKFDIRMWVLISQNMEVFYFKYIAISNI